MEELPSIFAPNVDRILLFASSFDYIRLSLQYLFKSHVECGIELFTFRSSEAWYDVR